MNRRPFRNRLLPLLTIAVFSVLMSLGTLSYFSLRIFERSLLPEMERKAIAIGTSVSATIIRAAEFGISPNALRGVNEFFSGILANHPEITYLAFRDDSGAIVFHQGRAYPDRTIVERSGPLPDDPDLRGNPVTTLTERGPDTALPVLFGDRAIGILHVGLDQNHVRGKLREILFDVLTVLVISLLVTHELLRFLITPRITGPIGTGLPAASGNRLVAVRLAIFLFFFAEEMNRSFLPLHISEVLEHTPLPWLAADIAIGLPIALFMFIVALTQPLGGVWSDRVGRRRAFVTGALLASSGLVLTGFARGLHDLMLWRALTAVGYGLVFLTCQGYVADHTTPRNRARGMAVFVGGVMTAAICGPAIGGIIADRIGFPLTFVLSALLSLLSVVVVHHFLDEAAGSRARPSRRIGLRDIRTVLSNRRFLTLMLFAAIPAKIALTGFLYYLVPLYLVHLGDTQSTIGRVVMTYGIAMVLLGPLAAGLADRHGLARPLIALGGILAGTGMLGVLVVENTWTVLTAVLALGIAHGMSVATQLALVPDICPRECEQLGQTTVLGVFRLFERLGSTAGPLVAGLLLAFGDYEQTAAGIGLLLIVTALLFMASSAASGTFRQVSTS